jgi:hypothetical protein
MIDSDLEGFKTPSRNVYVERGVLYSYGSHYPMAKKYSIGTGYNYEQIILINSNKSSNTTERQKYHLRNSLTPIQHALYVPYVNDLCEANEQHLINVIADRVGGVFSWHKYSSLIFISNAINNLNKYRALKYWSLYKRDLPESKKFKLPDDLMFDLNLMVRQRIDRELELNKTREAKQLAKDKEIIDRTHSNLHLWITRDNFSNLEPRDSEVDKLAKASGHDYCRVSTDNTNLITQRGATVSLETVKRLINIGNANGFESLILKSAGPFKITAYDQATNNLTIGCHTINISQVKDALKAKGL